jgi:hypothetical protein
MPPWSWVVWLETPELAAERPFIRDTIGMFATVNVIAAFIMAIFGNSTIKHRLMCGHCQKENIWKGSFLAIALNLLANLAVVYLI